MDVYTQKRRAVLRNRQAGHAVADILAAVLVAIAIVIVMDIVSFVAWAMSEQTPVDGLFLGKLTHTVISSLV